MEKRSLVSEEGGSGRPGSRYRTSRDRTGLGVTMTVVYSMGGFFVR